MQSKFAANEVGSLRTAIDEENWEHARALFLGNPDLHHAPLGYGDNGPLTWLAECRVPWKPPTPERLQMAEWMIANGSDVHQGGDGPLMRATLMDYRLPMAECLVAQGANVNARWGGTYPILLGPCETLNALSLRWLLSKGARAESHAEYGNPLSMVVGTYSRDAKAKQSCLAVLAEYGQLLPDTVVMALHRGQTGEIASHLRRDPDLLHRRFTTDDIFPLTLGMMPSEVFTWTSVAGTTLLHLAVEFADAPMVSWLIDRGADVNARATIGTDGVGGHTPLFHAAIFGDKTDEIANLLLQNGADPYLRATLQKDWTNADDPAHNGKRTFRDVTPFEYAAQYAEPQWVNKAAVAAIAAASGER